MKENLLAIFHSPNYQPMTFAQLSQELNLEEDQEPELKRLLIKLLDDYEIFLSRKKDRYLRPKDVNTYKGIMSIRSAEFGFVSSDEFENDLYVPKQSFHGAIDKDEVLFQTQESKNANFRDFKQEAKVLKILKRNLKNFVGELKTKKGGFFIEPNHYQIQTVDIISGGIMDLCAEGDIVRVEITDYESDPMKAKIVERIGFKNDIGIDILQIASSFDFPSEFKKETTDFVNRIDPDISAEVIKRKKPSLQNIITIDGDDAKDLDDAVAIKKTQDGNYFLGVYIADVSHYVTEGSPLDDEALFRGTSVYLVNRVIPMLPTRLSNDLCSLNPDQNKLALACEMVIDQSGKVIDSSIFPTVIKTKYRMTYNNVNGILAGKPELLEKYQSIHADVLLMNELREILNNMRRGRGALDFDIDEGKIVVNEEGKPTEIKLDVRGISERIIEELMLIANETVATTIFNLDLPFIYRVHEEPNLVKLDDFKALCKNLGYSVFRKKVNSKQLQDFLAGVKEEDAFLRTFLLRSMAKAVYSEENIGHYGLASSCYTHFTSPIRRYPDLLVHRLLRKYLFHHQINPNEFYGLTEKIHGIALQTSKRERDSIECEYQVDDMKKAEYMENFIGQRYEGIISSVTKFGVFVSLPNTVEGLVHTKNMKGRYVYDQKTVSLVGSDGHTLKLGDKVLIEVLDANKIKREIDFKIVYNEVRVKASGKNIYHRPKQKSRS